MNSDSSNSHDAILPSDSLARLREIFVAVVDLDSAARAEWLTKHVSDPEEFAAIERLLSADALQSGFLDTPASAHVAHLSMESLPQPEGLIGQQIGVFRLTRLLGKGGMAAVFLGERITGDFRQNVAVKILRHGLYSEFEQRLFLRERELLATLQHPNIAHLIDGGITAAGIPYLILEFVDGEWITRYAAAHRLGIRARLKLFCIVCRAVEAAHRSLIVHRDIKPSNILVTAAGEVKLLDFGIAKLLDEDNEAATFGVFTPDYAAPEQLSGAAVTTATDVYALGVLLHELLVEQRPKLGSLRRPSALTASESDRRTLRGDLDTIVLKALAAEPDQRYASAIMLAEDIERHLAGRPVLAHAPTHWYRTLKFVRRNRGGVVVTATFLLAIFAAAAAALWQGHIARREAQRAKAVRDFLVQVFDAAKADLPHNERPTPEILVREASQRARADVSIDPEQRADLLYALAEVDLSLGEYAQAEALLDEARQRLDEAGVAADAPARLDLAVLKANVFQRSDRNAAATALLESVLPQLRRQATPTAVAGLQTYAMSHAIAGREEEANTLAREAAAKAAQVYSADSLEAMKAALFPSEVLIYMQRHKESLPLLEPLVARWRSLGLPQDIDFAQAVGALAVAKNLNGETAEAEALFRENIALRRRIYAGRTHDRLASELEAFAIFLIAQERFDEARPLLEEALSIDRTVLDPGNSEIASKLDTLGALELARRDFAAAEKYLRESLALYVASVDQSDQIDDLALTRGDLARVLIQRGAFDEAAALDAAALAALRARHGENDRYVAGTLSIDARLALARGDPASALATIDHAQEILGFVQSPGQHLISTISYVRAQALAGLDRHGEAIEEIAHALVAQRTANVRAHSKFAMLLALRAREENALGQTAAAAATIAEAKALAVPDSLLAPEDIATLR